MTILAIDQASNPNSVAIVREATVCAECRWEPQLRNNRALFDRLHEVQTAAGIDLRAVDAYAVGVGPGSFTGVRCSVSAVRALAMPAQTPVAGISSAAAIAWEAARETGTGDVTVVGDARRHRLWTSRFRIEDGTLTQTGDFALIQADALSESLPRGTLVVSPDYERLHAELAAPGGERLLEGNRAPDAATIAQLARKKLDAGDDLPPPVPIYLHPPVFVAPRFAVRSVSMGAKVVGQY